MKTLIVTLAAATALTASAAVAQPYGYGRSGMSIEQRIERIDFRIDQGVRSGQLTRREAYNLRAQLNGVVRLEARYSRNGLSEWERVDLNHRLDALSDNVRVARRDDDRRYGYNNQYPPY
ncbi:MAG TPA: hypothetical protein VJU34_13275 [Phenylobacterium sp.]|nr:hypothetical protein [Phenylobacterium sp.]